MENQSVTDRLSARAVALLLILTTWGHAVVLFVVAVLGLGASVIFLQKRAARGGTLAATVGFVMAVAMALPTLLA
jgi:hypothetical protein